MRIASNVYQLQWLASIQRQQAELAAIQDQVSSGKRISTAADVLEFMIAGATAVQVGTANFVDPFLWGTLVEGLCAYMDRHGLTRLAELTGTLDTTRREQAWTSS